MVSEQVDPPTTLSEDDEIAECYIRMQGKLREMIEQMRQMNASRATGFAEIKQTLATERAERTASRTYKSAIDDEISYLEDKEVEPDLTNEEEALENTAQLHRVTFDVVGDTTEEDDSPEITMDEGMTERMPQLSLCAPAGNVQEPRCNTMRVEGKIEKGSVNILIDSVSREVCRGFSWVLLSNGFRADVFLLRLGCCDIVRGVEWLATWRDIVRNFQELTMRFTYEARAYLLRGSTEFKREGIGVHTFEKLVQRASCSSDPLTSYLDAFAEPMEFTMKFTKNGQQYSIQVSKVCREESRWLLDDDDLELDEEKKEGLSFVEEYGLDEEKNEGLSFVEEYGLDLSDGMITNAVNDDDSFGHSNVKMSSKGSVAFYCINCSSKLTTQPIYHFTEMPLVNWQEAADNWFRSCRCSFGDVSEKLVNKYPMSYACTKGKCFLNSSIVIISKDDLLGPEFQEIQSDSRHENQLIQDSCNKVRKLEFLLADAVSQGADCVIAIGGTQSNHYRATAVVDKYLNLYCYLILRTSKALVDNDPGLTGNVLVDRLVGAHVDLISKEEYAKIGSVPLTELLKEKLQNEGRKPYVIPVGGSNSLGTWGYVEVIREIEQQMQVGKTKFDDIIVACGSGGTIVGLSLGSWLSSLKAKVHVFSVCDDPEYFHDFFQGLLDGLEAGVHSRDIVNIQNAKVLGHALSTTEELRFVKEIATATGVILALVYSGKAVYDMMKDMKDSPEKWEGRRVPFVHTGGLLGLFDKVDQMALTVGNWHRRDVHESFPRKDGVDEAAWKCYYDRQKRFPDFQLEQEDFHFQNLFEDGDALLKASVLWYLLPLFLKYGVTSQWIRRHESSIFDIQKRFQDLSVELDKG